MSQEVVMSFLRSAAVAALLLVGSTPAFAQTPPDYQAVLTSLGRAGDFKDGVLKVNIPRSDLKVVIGAAIRRRRRSGSAGGWR